MMEEQHKKLESQLLQRKLQLMRQWTALFLNDPHRSVMNILCGIRLKTAEKFDKNSPNLNLKDIRDIDDILTELKNGKLIQIEESRPTKGEKKTEFIQIDFNFFNVYQTLTTLILQEIKPRLQKFKKSKSGETKMVCKICKIEKTESQIEFLGLKCSCTNPHFVPVEPNKKENQRLQIIRSALQKRFLYKKKQIDDLERRLAESHLKTKKNEEDKKTNQFDQFCTRYDLPRNKPQFFINRNNLERLRAQNLYGRHQNFRFVNELKKIREMREKSRQSNRKIDVQIQQL